MVDFVPNEADASVAGQAQLDAVDLEILRAGVSGQGFWDYGAGGKVGCALTAQGSPDTTAAVADGYAYINGRVIRVTGANTASFAVNSGVGDRYDLVTIDTTGAIAIVEGDEHATNPVFPDIPADEVVIASVYIPSTETVTVVIATGDIVDKRQWVSPHHIFLEVQASRRASSTEDYLVNSRDTWTTDTLGSTVNNTDDEGTFQLFYVPSKITVASIGFYINALCDASATGTPVVRMGIFLPDTEGVPGELLVEAGTAGIGSTDGTGAKFITISGNQVLMPGWYYLCMAVQDIVNSGVNPTFGAEAGMEAARGTTIGLANAASNNVSNNNIVTTGDAMPGAFADFNWATDGYANTQSFGDFLLFFRLA